MNFITPLTLSTLSGHEVMHDMWAERKGDVEHMEIAKWADVFLVYPATVNIIGKFANGIADDLLSTVFLALPFETIKIICPAANTKMYTHPIVRKNIEKLNLTYWGLRFFGPEEGRLACGDVGLGKASKPREVVEFVTRAWAEIHSSETK